MDVFFRLGSRLWTFWRCRAPILVAKSQGPVLKRGFIEFITYESPGISFAAFFWSFHLRLSSDFGDLAVSKASTRGDKDALHGTTRGLTPSAASDLRKPSNSAVDRLNC